METAPLWVGIDVAKDQLDVAIGLPVGVDPLPYAAAGATWWLPEFAPGVALQDIVNAVNEVGAAPGDLMAILEALKQSGALRAELVVI